MVMPAAMPPARWNRAMLEALPDDGQRHEIIDGVHYVTPSPGLPHQYVAAMLYDALRHYIDREPIGWLFFSPSDIELAPDTIVQPDVMVFPRRNDRLPRDWASAGLPMLVVEVISPSSSSRDRILKRRRYQRAGIAEYWIADPEAQLVERWTPTDERPEICTDTLRWLPDGAATELVIELQPIFAAIAAR
jgi:Uma2 family endonuclease